MWERRLGDDDLLNVRIGLGPAPLATPLRLDTNVNPLGEQDALSAHAAHRFVTRHGTVPDLPATIPLREAGMVGVAGDPAAAAALARALVCQAATFHSPEDVRLVLCASSEAAPRWDWVKWLPHTAPAGRRARCSGRTRLRRSRPDGACWCGAGCRPP